MSNETSTMSPATLRPAVDADTDAIAALWYRGWLDGHSGNVPAALLPHRQPADFHARVPERLDTTTVATNESGVVGFVVVQVDEVEQLYVDASARGTGVADTLLAHGEAVISGRFDRAWLAVVAGNARARRFYERNGWFDAGGFDYAAGTAAGTTIAVPSHRYEKPL